MASTSQNIHDSEDMRKEIEFLRAENEEKAMLNKTLRKPTGTTSHSTTKTKMVNYPNKKPKAYVQHQLTSQEEDMRHHFNTNIQYHSYSDFTICLAELEARLDAIDFIEWLRVVERVFNYQRTLKEKGFYKYAST